MLSNSILVLNGKGGVLKTSLTAQIAGITALSGWKVLAVDLDQQGNLARDLGYIHRTDGGLGLLNAITRGDELTPLADVRPNLDVITGGSELLKLYRHLALESGGRVVNRFKLIHDVLKPIAAGYNLVIFDAPPGGEVVQFEAMSAARFMVIPTQPDQGSIDGLASIFRILTEVRLGPNPALDVLGVVLGPVGAASTRLRADTIERLYDVTRGRVHVFSTIIRAAQNVAVDCRERGMLVHEYELDAASAPPWYKVSPEERAKQRGYSSAATGLADDYQSLVAEILERFVAQRWEEIAVPA
jgi:chromosome partitioning protein